MDSTTWPRPMPPTTSKTHVREPITRRRARDKRREGQRALCIGVPASAGRKRGMGENEELRRGQEAGQKSAHAQDKLEGFTLPFC